MKSEKLVCFFFFNYLDEFFLPGTQTISVRLTDFANPKHTQMGLVWNIRQYLIVNTLKFW